MLLLKLLYIRSPTYTAFPEAKREFHNFTGRELPRKTGNKNLKTTYNSRPTIN